MLLADAKKPAESHHGVTDFSANLFDHQTFDPANLVSVGLINWVPSTRSLAINEWLGDFSESEIGIVVIFLRWARRGANRLVRLVGHK